MHTDNTTIENAFIKPIPSVKEVFRALLRADFRVQWRNRRALLMTLIMPLIFIISWKSLIPEIGGAAVLAICISVGLPATGLMAYSQSIARDRERGVFQRLRAAPIPTWAIMLSRITVQLAVIAVMSLVTYLVGHSIDNISIPLYSIPIMLIVAMIGGLAYLAIGQTVVGLIKSSDAVNAAARLIYLPLAIVGALGEIGLFGSTLQTVIMYSPFGTTKTLITWSVSGTAMSGTVLFALVLTLAYAAFFAYIGIRNFKWSVQ